MDNLYLPPPNPTQRRTRIERTRLTPDEASHLEKIAESHNTTKSEVIRKRVFQNYAKKVYRKVQDNLHPGEYVQNGIESVIDMLKKYKITVSSDKIKTAKIENAIDNVKKVLEDLLGPKRYVPVPAYQSANDGNYRG